MKAENITTKIQKIKSQIARASYETAFDNLEQLIISIEGEEVENPEETELLNQLILIRARYNAYRDKMISGVEDQQTELNQIVNSLILLTDKTHTLFKENPHYIIPPKTEEITANYVVETEDITETHDVPISNPQADNSGCMFSLSKSSDETNVNVQANPLRLFGGMAILILAMALAFWLMTNSDACNQQPPPNPPTPPDPVDIIDTTQTTNPGEEHKDKREIATTAEFSADMERLADALRDKSENGKTFTLDNTAFEKNSHRLTTKAKKELDDLVKILEQVPDLEFTISGRFADGEKSKNKENTLDEKRARAVKEYLQSKGIPIRRMEFEGDDYDPNGNTGIRIGF